MLLEWNLLKDSVKQDWDTVNLKLQLHMLNVVQVFLNVGFLVWFEAFLYRFFFKYQNVDVESWFGISTTLGSCAVTVMLT